MTAAIRALAGLSSAAPVAGGDILSYNFDGSGPTIVDRTGIFDATIAGNVTRSPIAQYGEFSIWNLWNGTSADRVEMGTYNFPASALTLAFWLRITDYASPDGRIISKAAGPLADEHTLMISMINSGENLRFRLNTQPSGTTETLVATGSSLSLNIWYHVAVTYDGAEMRIWLNQTSVANVGKTGTVTQDERTCYMLNQPNANSPLAGRVDNFRIYDRALTSEELTTDANTPVL